MSDQQIFKYKISVSICSYNRARFILKTLESIRDQNYPKEHYEVLVVDNNSTENVVELVEQFRDNNPQFNLKIFIEQNQGVAYARTRGAREAQGEIVAYIDDDSLATEGWLQMIHDFFDEHPNTYSIGGKITPYFLTEIPEWYSKYFFGLVGNFDQGKKIKRLRGQRYPCGANMSFRSEVFKTIGFFNHELGRSGTSLVATEEKDIYLRILAQGWDVYYLPKLEVLHAVEMNKFTKDYVIRHSRGIGAGERLMLKARPWKLFVKFLEYVAKWGYAILYGLGFIIKGQWSKFRMLERFRWWVIEGFLFPQGAK